MNAGFGLGQHAPKKIASMTFGRRASALINTFNVKSYMEFGHLGHFGHFGNFESLYQDMPVWIVEFPKMDFGFVNGRNVSD